jgi:DNA-binding transcriptional LysR family regulator
VHDAAEEMAAHAGLRRGVVRLGCALQTLLETELPPLFAAFRVQHPGVRIAVRELHTRQILKLLSRGEVELGLVHLGRVEGGRLIGAESASPDLALLRLRREPLVAIVGPRHRLAGRARLRFSALRDEPFVAFQPGATVRLLVAQAAARHGFEPQIAFSTANLSTVKALVSAELGVAVVPRSALDAPGPPLRALELEEPRLERVVVLARNKARYEGPAAAAVRRALSESIAPR